MVTLLYGLPLLTAYTYVDSSFYLFVLLPYLAASFAITVVMVGLSQRSDSSGAPPCSGDLNLRPSHFIAGLNSISPYYTMGIASLAIASYSAMRFLVASAFPYPPSGLAGVFGGAYVSLLVISSVLVFSRIIYSSFPSLAKVLSERRYSFLAVSLAITFAFVYLLLVEQIVIPGYNEIGVISPPGQYPFLHVFTVGPQQPLVNFIYIPYILVQISPLVTILVIPFEMIFGVLIALLTASNVVMAYYLIREKSVACCTKGTVMSTAGSILGLTATCPTCLVPSFVSVIFGGITAAEAAYSNIYGAFLPPVLSVAALLASLFYLSRSIERRTSSVSAQVIGGRLNGG
jgi:hypothetical protein